MGGTIIQKKEPDWEIRWAGLYDKNSDVQYVPRQFMSKSDYDEHFRADEEERVSKFRKFQKTAKEGIMKNN